MEFRLVSLDLVSPNCFVKLRELDIWFFIGEEDELDATKIIETDEKYSVFISKKLGDKVSLSKKYQSNDTEFEIEYIFSIEKYILWQCRYYAQKLTSEGRWDMITAIEVPQIDGTMDFNNLIAFHEDEAEKRREFFNLYCNQAVPLAFLAINEGSLTNAIGRIANEGRGYIKSSTRNKTEQNEQKEVAKKIIDGQPFYIDGTSALILSETGLLDTIYGFLPKRFCQ